MQIEIEIKNVYGKINIYPINAEAKVFAELLGQKTLTLRDIAIIKTLGYKVKKVENEELNYITN